jgi:hypothetical protein
MWPLENGTQDAFMDGRAHVAAEPNPILVQMQYPERPRHAGAGLREIKRQQP